MLTQPLLWCWCFSAVFVCRPKVSSRSQLPLVTKIGYIFSWVKAWVVRLVDALLMCALLHADGLCAAWLARAASALQPVTAVGARCRYPGIVTMPPLLVRLKSSETFFYGRTYQIAMYMHPGPFSYKIHSFRSTAVFSVCDEDSVGACLDARNVISICVRRRCKWVDPSYQLMSTWRENSARSLRLQIHVAWTPAGFQ